MTNNLLLPISIFLLFSQNLHAGDNGKTFEKRFHPKKAPTTLIEEAEARKFLSSGRPITAFREGIVQADTLHMPGSFSDHGWNALTKQWIVSTSTGNQAITFHRSTTIGSSSRYIPVYYVVQDTLLRSCDYEMMSGLGAGYPWIDANLYDQAILTWQGWNVERLIVWPCSPWESFPFPNPLDPRKNPRWPSLAVDKDINRIYWWSGGVDYTAFGDSQRVYYTDGWGSPWDSTALVWDMTNTGGYWAGSAITISNDNSKIAIWQRYDAVPLNGDTADYVLYSMTDNKGDSWNITYVSQQNVSPKGIADPIITAFGYDDTLQIHPSMGIDLGFDYQNNVHMVMNGFAYHAINDSEIVNTTGILHYSSVRGARASNFVEISDPSISHAAFIDTAINLEMKRYTGNGVGFNMPTIASAKDAPVHFTLWVQWNGADAGNLFALLADTGATGFFTNAIWGAWSFDGGNRWDSPYEVASVPGASLEFVTLDPWLEKIDDIGNYRWHALWLEDRSPGISVFGEGDFSMNPWVYATDTVRFINVGIKEENSLPNQIALSQNHPNPFNPLTNISYSLSVSGDVSLIIYNLLGEEVARLVDGHQTAGEYQTEWNASNVSSGIYFYRLQADDFVQTRKMILLK